MSRRTTLLVISLLAVGAVAYGVWLSQQRTPDEVISDWRESVNADCPVATPTQEDVSAAASIGERLDSDEWVRQISTQPGMVTVLWQHKDKLGLMHSHYLLLDCGY